MDSKTLATILTASATILTAVATLVGTFIGKRIGSRGKKKGFENLQTELALDGTTWDAVYKIPDEDGTQTTISGWIKFRQYGSRITGDAGENKDQRNWILEGVVYKGRLCYVYVDTNPLRTSLGTSSFTIDGNGDELIGTWTGWAPDGRALVQQEITLTRNKSQ